MLERGRERGKLGARAGANPARIGRPGKRKLEWASCLASRHLLTARRRRAVLAGGSVYFFLNRAAVYCSAFGF